MVKFSTYSRNYYSNQLHDSLAAKDCPSFWRIWKSKFTGGRRDLIVDNSTNDLVTLEKFRGHFAGLVNLNPDDNARHCSVFNELFAKYDNHQCGRDDTFRLADIDRAMEQLGRGKAADIDGLQAEHLLFCHPVVNNILLILFNLVMFYSAVPNGFFAVTQYQYQKSRVAAALRLLVQIFVE